MDRQLADELLAESVTIPTLPSVVQRIQLMLANPDVSLRVLGREVAKDAPISTKILRIANSAYYGARERVVSTEHASSVLGLKVLRNIVLQASVLGQYKHLNELGDFDVEGLWKHSICTAQLCQDLASLCTAPLGLAPEEFHSAGLLHDIGQVVLLDCMQDKFLEAARAARELAVSPVVAEQAVIGYDHAQVGALVAHRWGLPKILEHAILEHHGELEDVIANPAVALVALCNLVGEVAGENDRDAALASWAPELGKCLGLSVTDFTAAVDRALKHYSEIEI